MSKQYKTLAKSIVELVGGCENIVSAEHCMTRLRFVLQDNAKAKKEKLKGLDGVVQILENGGQFQVVIGPHVEEVYDEVQSFLGQSVHIGEKEVKRNIGDRIVDFVSGIFAPIIPAMAGAGMIKAFLAVLMVFNLVDKTSQTYFIVNFIADATFYFLPFLLAYSAGMKLKCSPILSMVLAGVLLHPNLAALKKAGDAVYLFGLPVELVSYASSVVPIILIVYLQSYVERFLKSHIPDAIKIIFVPMLTILFTAVVGLTLLGPIGAFIGTYMAWGFDFLNTYASWLIIFLIATFWPLMVMFGIHYSLSPLSVAQLATLGYENIIGPGAILSNIAQGIAALIVSLRTKDRSVKQVSVSSGITALMGITEPALYGVNLPKKYPLIAAMIGGACGGLYAGLMNVSRYATGSSGLPAIPLYIGEDIRNLYNILIALGITMIVTAVTAWLLSLKFESGMELETKELVKHASEVLLSPISGKVESLSQIPDEAFSTGAMGQGLTIVPEEGIVTAPADGEITAIFPTGHAIGFLTVQGTEILIHIGIDTVELKGKYFHTKVKQGDKVKAGQILVEFELENIKASGYKMNTPIIVTNSQAYKEIVPEQIKYVERGNKLLTLIA